MEGISQVSIICGKKKEFKTQEKWLGSGNFGVVVQGLNTIDDKKVAIKLEKKNNPNPKLVHEFEILSILFGGVGIPQVFFCGPDLEKRYNCLVMELLGKSLEMFIPLSMKSCLMLAIQMIERLQYIHKKNIVHRDIKPDNIMVGYDQNNQNTIYLGDFGLARVFRNKRTVQHIISNGKGVRSQLFASSNAHLDKEMSRRDDLESLIYVIMYCYDKKSLPWEKGQMDEIAQMKNFWPAKKICQGFNSRFVTYLDYCRGLEFEEEPDYTMLKYLFVNCLQEEEEEFDQIFDWNESE